jgi:LAO/AO transport system kinase
MATSGPAKQKKQAHGTAAELVERMRAGDIRALARAISLVENDAPEATAILSACFPHTGDALCVGITGAPGAGKSTLVDRLAKHYRGEKKQVGIVAVDPTSPYTGGAILGDRIRMQEHYADDGLYIRSMATRGFLGGLARTTADVAAVIEASGKDMMLLETVGVGQDEVDIVRLADVTVVILVPGMGDDVQSIKAGIMEIANIFVVNKSDREGADRVEREIRAMQSLSAAHDADDWIAPVVRTVASEGEGVEELAAAIARYQGYLSERGRLTEKRASNWRERLLAMVQHRVTKRLAQMDFGGRTIDDLAHAVAAHEVDPYELLPKMAQQILGAAK